MESLARIQAEVSSLAEEKRLLEEKLAKSGEVQQETLDAQHRVEALLAAASDRVALLEVDVSDSRAEAAVAQASLQNREVCICLQPSATYKRLLQLTLQ